LRSTSGSTIPYTRQTTTGLDGSIESKIPSFPDSQGMDPAIVIGAATGGTVVIAMLCVLFLWRRWVCYYPWNFLL